MASSDPPGSAPRPPSAPAEVTGEGARDEAPDHDAILARREALIRAAQQPAAQQPVPLTPPAPMPCLNVAPPPDWRPDAAPHPCLSPVLRRAPAPDSDPPPEARVATRRALHSGPRVPYAPPAWLAPRAVASLAVGAGGALAVFALDALDGSRGDDGSVLVPALAFVSACFAAVVAAVVTGARGAARAGARAAITGAGATVLLVMVAVLVSDEAQSAMLAAATIALGALLGVAVAVVGAPPLLVASRALRRPTHDGPDAALLAAGGWLAAVGVATGVLSASARNVASDARGLLAALAGVVLGGALFLVGRARIAARLAWLGRVRRGEVPGWRVARRDAYPAPPAALPPLVRLEPHPSETHYDGVLLASAATPASQGYRDARDEQPAARVAFDGTNDALARAVGRAYLSRALPERSGVLIAMVVVLMLALGFLFAFAMLRAGDPPMRVG